MNKWRKNKSMKENTEVPVRWRYHIGRLNQTKGEKKDRKN